VRTADLRIHIRQLCCLGVTGEQLMPSLLKSVRQLVGAESAAFFWVDAQGDMTSLYAERLLPAPVMQLYFERFYDAGESSFKRAFAERARQSDPVLAVSASTAAERSAYYNEVMRHLDAHHVLYGVVREQGEALGQLSLYRPKSARTFSTAERGELTAIMRYVAHGVSARTRAEVGAQTLLDTADDAVFLIAADGGLREVSPSAQKLLALATHGRIAPGAGLAVIGESARPALRRLVAQLREALNGVDVGPPSVVLDNAWGRFVLRAYALADDPFAGDASLAVRIQRQEPMLLRFVDALQGFGLSPQQREIAAGLAKGASNQELAEALGVSANTIAYHIKQLFARLDTHDRQQMVGRVLGRSGVPH
jgi:DNA-binding CsgD family transcriptional regulator/PAS domain-containing protein